EMYPVLLDAWKNLLFDRSKFKSDGQDDLELLCSFPLTRLSFSYSYDEIPTLMKLKNILELHFDYERFDEEAGGGGLVPENLEIKAETDYALFKHIAPGLRENTSLKILRVSGNVLGVGDAKTIAAILETNKTLTELYLSHSIF